MSVSYGQKAVTGNIVTQYSISPNSGWVVLQNESPYTLQCTIDGTGSTRSIPALSIEKIPIPANRGFNGNIVLLPTVVLTNFATAPSFAVILDAYGRDEEPAGSYPVALARTIQVGGSVSTVSTTANTLTNTGNAALANVITIQPSDAGAATVSLDNSGNLLIKGDNAGVLTQLLQLIAGASPKVLLAVAGVLTEVAGTFQVDQSATITGGLTVNQAGLAVNIANGSLQVAAGITNNGGLTQNGNIALGANSINTTGTASFGTTTFGNGTLINAGDHDFNGHKALNVLQLKFNNGNLIAGINCGTFTAGALTGTQSHGLVGTPSVVIIGGADTSGTTTSAAFSYTSTQFSWRVNNSGQVMAWLAMKFA